MVLKDKPLSSIKADIVHAFLSVSLRRPTQSVRSLTWQTDLSPTNAGRGPWPGDEQAVILSNPRCGPGRGTGRWWVRAGDGP